MTALLAVAGLVYDGSEALAAKIVAIDEAQEAGRAGAQQIAWPSSAPWARLSWTARQRIAAAQAYLSAAGTGGAQSPGSSSGITQTAGGTNQIQRLVMAKGHAR